MTPHLYGWQDIVQKKQQTKICGSTPMDRKGLRNSLISMSVILIAGLDGFLKGYNDFIYRKEKTCSNLI